MARIRHGRRVVRGPRPTGRGYGLMAAGLVLLAGSLTWWRQDLLLLGLALLLFPFASMLAVGLARPRLTVARSLAPDTVAAGEETTVVVTLTNSGGAAPGILAWRDLTGAGIGEHTRQRLPVAAASGFATGHGSLVLRHTVRTERRGVYTVGPVAIVEGDPFGLARRERALGPTASLIVTPRVDPLGVDDLGAAGGDGSEREVLRRANPGADEVIAREYRTGDPLRRVHWRATARLGELMVRQEEQHSDPEAWIVFDTHVAGAPRAEHPLGRHGDAQFERAVRLVASLGSRLLGLGYQVRIVETGWPQLGEHAGVAAFDRTAGTRTLLASLAGVQQEQRPNGALDAALLGGLRRAGTAPVFAVLLGDAERHLDALGQVPAVSSRATAFVPRAQEADEDPLVSAGWWVTPYPRIGGRRG